MSAVSDWISAGLFWDLQLHWCCIKSPLFIFVIPIAIGTLVSLGGKI